MRDTRSPAPVEGLILPVGEHGTDVDLRIVQIFARPQDTVKIAQHISFASLLTGVLTTAETVDFKDAEKLFTTIEISVAHAIGFTLGRVVGPVAPVTIKVISKTRIVVAPIFD